MFEINHTPWKIKLVSANHPKIQRSDGKFTLGSCDDTNHTIYLSDNIPDYKLKKVLCHEITHAAMFSYGVQLTYDQEEFGLYARRVLPATKLHSRTSMDYQARFLLGLP